MVSSAAGCSCSIRRRKDAEAEVLNPPKKRATSGQQETVTSHSVQSMTKTSG
ncbi:hypothetical protein C0J52_22002 [Blattella germanica]|nr:hypothetical protein C0J52_22002 [Blattella germanica]